MILACTVPPGVRPLGRDLIFLLGVGGRVEHSSIPKLPPLNKQQSLSLPSMMDYVDPRDVKMNELEKV